VAYEILEPFHFIRLRTIFAVTNIMSSFVPASLRTVVICGTTVATLTSHCYTNWEPVLTVMFPGHCDASAVAVWRAFRFFLSALPVVSMLRVLTRCSCVGRLWWGEFREERSPRGSLRRSLCSSPLQSSFREAASSIWRRTRFLPVCWAAIATATATNYICLFRTLPMQLATGTPRI
jgi:hypothetical protein